MGMLGLCFFMVGYDLVRKALDGLHALGLALLSISIDARSEESSPQRQAADHWEA